MRKFYPIGKKKTVFIRGALIKICAAEIQKFLYNDFMTPKTDNTVIEPEVIDENGIPITPQPDHARPQGDTSGVLGGMLVLAVGFVMTLAVALFTLFVICPLMLLGRLLGWEIKRFRH